MRIGIRFENISYDRIAGGWWIDSDESMLHSVDLAWIGTLVLNEGRVTIRVASKENATFVTTLRFVQNDLSAHHYR